MGIPAHEVRVTGVSPVRHGQDAHATCAARNGEPSARFVKQAFSHSAMIIPTIPHPR
jgi:hypothetical protein